MKTSPKPTPHSASNSNDQYSNGQSNDPLAANPSPSQPTFQDTKLMKPRRQMRGLSLKNKATALAIALGVLPVLAVGATNYVSSSKDIREAAITRQQGTAVALGSEISRYMFERYGDVQALANLAILTNPKETAEITFQQKQETLNKLIKIYGAYDSIAVTDLAGNTILQNSGEPITGLSERDYFKEVIKTKRPVITPPRKSKLNGGYYVFSAAPVMDSTTGKIIGMVRTRIPVKILDQILRTDSSKLTEGIGSAQEGNWHLIDAEGKIFVAKEGNQVLGEDVRKAIPVFAQLEAAKKAASAEGFDVSDPDKQLVTYAPVEQIEGLPNLNWSVLVHQDTAVIFAGQRRLLLTLLFGTGMTALLVGAIAAYLADRATRPILSATNAVKKLGQGELDTRIAVKGEDEFAILGSNINRMAGQLQDSLREQEVDNKRTKLFADITALRTGDTQEVQTILNTAVTGAREKLNADRVVVYRFNSDRSGYIAAESVLPGLPQALEEKVTDPCIPEQLIEAYRNGRVVPTNNVFETDYSPEHMELLKRLEIKSNLVTPIVQNGNVFGLLVAHYCSEFHVWQQSEIDFVAQLATQVGLPLDRVGSLEQITTAKETLQRRALELLMEVDPLNKGDLTIRANVTEDEIGTIADSYNSTISSLRKIVTQVQAAATQMATTTSSSEVSSQGLSVEALRQTQEITVALNQIQEMSDSIRAVAVSAEQAEAAMQLSTQTVEAGDAAMNRTVDGIMAIRETVAQTSKKVKRLGESSQKISKVVNLIGTFAAQTNLLALNAAIEAANAGEQGRGFAVVADQVRGLARQSANATAEIESLVMDIQTETNEVVAAMEAGTEQVVEGTKLVEETRQSLNQITAVSNQISALVQAIASATVAQSQASESVTHTMTDVAAIASQTSNEANQVSTSFKELLAVAQELQASASQFKVS